MGAASICNCRNSQEKKILAPVMTAPIILVDDPLLVYYNKNDLNQTSHKRLEDLIITSSYKSNKLRNLESPCHIMMTIKKNEYWETTEAIDHFIENLKEIKSEIDLLRHEYSCSSLTKEEKFSKYICNLLSLFNDKHKLFGYLNNTLTEIQKFKKLILESLEVIKRNIKCTKYNIEITIFENYIMKKFNKNMNNDFEQEIESIDKIYYLISEDEWNIKEGEVEELYMMNRENIKLCLGSVNEEDFMKFIKMLAEIRRTLIKLRNINEELVYVLKEIYSPFKSLLEKLNRNTRVFNNNFENDVISVERLLKFYNGSLTKHLKKISYVLN